MLVPFLPVAHDLGFTAIPAHILVVLVGITLLYGLAVELNKARFYRAHPAA
jgi:hypothetical protein